MRHYQLHHCNFHQLYLNTCRQLLKIYFSYVFLISLTDQVLWFPQTYGSWLQIRGLNRAARICRLIQTWTSPALIETLARYSHHDFVTASQNYLKLLCLPFLLLLAYGGPNVAC